MAIHDPAKVVTDLAVTLAVGGDCLADIATLRDHPEVYGLVASDPMVSRTITALAADAPVVLRAINTRPRRGTRPGLDAGRGACPRPRHHRRQPAGHRRGRDSGDRALGEGTRRPTFKRGFGFHPVWAFLDHGPEGSGEPLAFLLRPGNTGSNTAVDHITVVRQALQQLPGHRPGTRPGRKVLIRTDAAGAGHDFMNWLVSQRLSYSIGFTLPTDFARILSRVPKAAWTPAYNADRQPRDGAWVAEVTDLLDLSGWPAGMRVIIRKERPHPGAQLRITNVDGHRITAFATNTTKGQLAHLELRHRRRARAEDRIRCAKDTGLRNLPPYSMAQNQVWCALVALACELTVWMQMLAFTGHAARRWEPKRLRLRLFSTAGTLARTGRQTFLRLAHDAWTDILTHGLTRLRTLPDTG